MVMKLAITTTAYNPPEDQSWLSSAHGLQSADSITLDGANLAALFPTGFVPSGIPLKRVSGKYQACISTDVPEYFLFTSQDLTHGGDVPAATDTPAAGLWTAEVIASKVPAYTGKTSVVAANTTSGLFKFV